MVSRIGYLAAVLSVIVSLPCLSPLPGQETAVAPAQVATQEPQVAEDAGQTKLDEATALKISASSPADLAKVIELCEAAIEAGLDEGTAQLARQLLAASAFQRSQFAIQGIPAAAAANNASALRNLRRKAMDDLKKAVESNPNMAEAYVQMAKLEALPGGDRGDSMTYLNKAIELLKDKPVDQSDAYIMRAQLQEDIEGRLKDLRSAVKANSTNSDAWQALIVMQLQVGKFQEAVDDAKKLLEKEEGNVIALQAAIEALLGLKKADEAIDLLTSRIEKEPKNGAYHRVRGLAYRQKSDSEGISEKDAKVANELALADFNKALELDPRDAEAMIGRGTLYYLLGEVEKANRDISDSLLIEPNSYKGVWMRSAIAAQEGRFGDAVSDMEMLVRANPTEVRWIEQLAKYYQLDKRPRLAIQLLDRVVEADKDNWRALHQRGDARLSVSLHGDAVTDYEAAIRILEEQRAAGIMDEESARDYEGLLNNLAWVLATSPKDELRNGQRSVELGLKACEATEYKKSHILSTLGAGYAEVGDFENARKWSAKAVELAKEEIENGLEKESVQLEQLEKELDSYKSEKPWREEQTTDENEKPLVAPSGTIDT